MKWEQIKKNGNTNGNEFLFFVVGVGFMFPLVADDSAMFDYLGYAHRCSYSDRR